MLSSRWATRYFPLAGGAQGLPTTTLVQGPGRTNIAKPYLIFSPQVLL